jgi:hypothetical protein
MPNTNPLCSNESADAMPASTNVSRKVSGMLIARATMRDFTQISVTQIAANTMHIIASTMLRLALSLNV